MNRTISRKAPWVFLSAALLGAAAQAQVPSILKQLLPGELSFPPIFPPIPGISRQMPRAMPGLAWMNDLKAGDDNRAAGRNAEAAAAYERALQDIAGVPQLAGSEVLMLPSYGAVLLKLQRFDEAERALLRAMALETEQVAAARGNASIHSAMLALHSARQLASEGARQLNRSLILEGPNGDPRPADVLSMPQPEPRQTIALLSQVYTQRGTPADRDKLLQLFRDVFPRFLARIAQERDRGAALAAIEGESVSLHLAVALARAGLREEANELFGKAMEFNGARLSAIGGQSTLLDVQIGGFQRRRMITAAYASHVMSGPANAADTEAVLAALTSGKGLASRYANRRRTLLNTLPDRTVETARDKLRALEESLRALPITGEAAIHAHVEWLNAYDAALRPAMQALTSGGLTSVFADGRAILAGVRKQLGQSDAVIGFQVHEPTDLATLKPKPARYLRYIITPQFMDVEDVGDKQTIDRLLRTWRADVDRPGLPPTGVALSKALLANLRPEVTNAQRWTLDPDGALALLPFEALPLGNGVVLDSHLVRYASSLATLVEGGATVPVAGQSNAIVLADPQYASAEQILSAAGNVGLRSVDRRVSNLQLKPLPDTRIEAQAVADAMKRLGAIPQVLLGAQATPTALRSVNAPRFVHVASHGLFLMPDIDPDDPARFRIAVVLPGMLTGLALTPDASGSMLWAADLAQMNLRGTSLVVLSACDTGNGLIDAGEGLTSLRRAAEEAGASATLTSLWPVSSRRTTELMTDLYQGLAAGEGKAGALRNAKLKARARGASVRDWSGFLLAGNDQ
ncbi:CHAT domain-containing protein [uncultured Ramlibacter sp.]|uniref:CHAT domain-containing protein n=1 Tax=uncultured Ramlibacter sp. TaxID=260755 RepID=UPI0026076208|nr:CHAT domain-containing protein [uncultured Ramlibacter sp.]